MIFKDLLLQIEIEDVVEYLKKEYEEKSEDAYLKMYHDLLMMTPEKSNLFLYVVKQKELSDESHEYNAVFGHSYEEDIDYGIDLTPWSEWLGMPVIEKSLEEFGKVAFVAECLYEMSFYSFDESAKNDFCIELNDLLEEIKSKDMKFYLTKEVFELDEEESKDKIVEVKKEKDINLLLRKQMFEK